MSVFIQTITQNNEVDVWINDTYLTVIATSNFETTLEKANNKWYNNLMASALCKSAYDCSQKMDKDLENYEKKLEKAYSKYKKRLLYIDERNKLLRKARNNISANLLSRKIKVTYVKKLICEF